MPKRLILVVVVGCAVAYCIACYAAILLAG